MIFKICRSSATEAPREPKMAPIRPKMASRRCQDEPRRHQHGPKRASGRVKMAQDGPRGAQESPKRAPTGGPRGLQEGSRNQLGSESPPGSSRDPPRPLRGAISGPVWSQKRTPGGRTAASHALTTATLLASCCAATWARRRGLPQAGGYSGIPPALWASVA